MRQIPVLFGALLLAGAASAQVKYASGQNIAPVFEGWERNPDGSFNMVFGYLNRNYEEEVDIPVGANNTVTRGSETVQDAGQPTHFYPRRQRFLFRVTVPNGWDKEQKVVWTLISRGRTDRANGWLQPEWELSEDVIVENLGGGIPDPNNHPPALTIGDVAAITLPNAATIAASATDDGLPKPPKRPPPPPKSADAPPRRPPGTQIKWIQYRGPGKVRFEPDASAVSYGEPVAVTSKVSFSAPGTYVLRATASDGQKQTARDVTVIVKP
jgi:hypothetical protein